MSKKKCPICGAEMKIDTSAVCTSIPPKYRCVCPSCNCLDFIKTSEYDQYKEDPSLPSNLDEAAEEYGRNIFINECMENGVCDDHDLSDAFKAGAEWRDAQIPKLPDNVDEAAFAYENAQWESGIKDCGYCPQDVYDAFKAGAEWMAGQGVSIPGKVGIYGVDVESITKELREAGFKIGEEVTLQVRKK